MGVVFLGVSSSVISAESSSPRIGGIKKNGVTKMITKLTLGKKWAHGQICQWLEETDGSRGMNQQH